MQTTPRPLKSEERKLEESMESMIKLISRLYRNQVILDLNQTTVDKFEDAQVGNYASVLTKLSNRTKKKLLSRFTNKRIQSIVNQTFQKSDSRSRKALFNQLGKSLAIEPEKLLKNDRLTPEFNALVLETSTWAQKLRDETLEMYTANTLRAMTLGNSVESILEQLDGMEEKRKNHARFTARNQLASFNSIITKTRAQKLGVKKAVWVTSGDERTRPSHQARDGKEFDLSKGLYSSRDGKHLLPGTDYQCRCTYQLILEDDIEQEETG